MTRDGLPRRHWIFPGHTVDVTTVEGVERDLEACRLGRWVLVGDAGMDSKENLKQLTRASGRYGRYARLTKTGKPMSNVARMTAAERLDGKFVAHSNDDTSSTQDMALGYKPFQRPEGDSAGRMAIPLNQPPFGQ